MWGACEAPSPTAAAAVAAAVSQPPQLSTQRIAPTLITGHRLASAPRRPPRRLTSATKRTPSAKRDHPAAAQADSRAQRAAGQPAHQMLSVATLRSDGVSAACVSAAYGGQGLGQDVPATALQRRLWELMEREEARQRAFAPGTALAFDDAASDAASGNVLPRDAHGKVPNAVAGVGAGKAGGAGAVPRGQRTVAVVPLCASVIDAKVSAHRRGELQHQARDRLARDCLRAGSTDREAAELQSSGCVRQAAQGFVGGFFANYWGTLGGLAAGSRAGTPGAAVGAEIERAAGKGGRLSWRGSAQTSQLAQRAGASWQESAGNLFFTPLEAGADVFGTGDAGRRSSKCTLRYAALHAPDCAWFC